MYCDLWLQYIKVPKLFKGGNYSRAETIWGNTVCQIEHKVMNSCLHKIHQFSLNDCWSKLLGHMFYNFSTYGFCYGLRPKAKVFQGQTFGYGRRWKLHLRSNTVNGTFKKYYKWYSKKDKNTHIIFGQKSLISTTVLMYRIRHRCIR